MNHCQFILHFTMSCHPVPFYAFLCQVISCHAVKLMTTRQLLDRRQVPEVRAGSISKIHAFCSESCLYHAVLQSMPCCASNYAMLCLKVCHAVPQSMPCCASKYALLGLKVCHAVQDSHSILQGWKVCGVWAPTTPATLLWLSTTNTVSSPMMRLS